MKKTGVSFELSATDLVGHLNCHHLTALDRAVAEGALPKPKVWDPLLQILSERGAAHEQSYVDYLTRAGLQIVRIGGVDVTDAAVADTLAAMQRGVPIIVQGALAHQGWNGRADILRRIEVPSTLGAWSYEPIDTKLARETKAGTILQLCLYADLLGAMQGNPPEYMYVVAPWSEFQPQQYRFADYKANSALAVLQANLELGNAPAVSDEIKEAVRAYNEDDCRSAAKLRDWLETHRATLAGQGIDVPRPQPGDGAPAEKITEWLIRVNALIKRLTADVPADPAERTEEQHARWLLANIVDWHRREEKAVWWEYFRLAALSGEDLLEERGGLSALDFAGAVGGTEKAPIHRYRFPPQETEIRGGEELCNLGGAKLGKVEAISFVDNTVDIKKRQDTADLHPQAVFAHSYIDTKVIAEALFSIGEHVADHGMLRFGRYQAARDLLLRESPRVGGAPLRNAGETTTDAAVRLCAHLAGGVLAIQGPPGAGKTFTGGRMICELVRRGKKVGITANSHKVIRNLIDATIKAADESGIDLQCCQKADEAEDPQHRLFFASRSEDLCAALSSRAASVGGGTAWLWSRPDAFEMVDVLFVDEAAQMSLANVLALSQAAKTVVLIGDPQQLEQPMQGSHPEGTDVSALDHILRGKQTMAPDKGLFLEETWRLHPAICAYTSELFYNGKLRSKSGLDRQVVKGSGPVTGFGLYFLPVLHSGNQNCSLEEAQAVGRLVQAILAGSTTWVDPDGKERPITLADILIITPYNAQVFEIQQWFPGARVGTVDKFQGQEAPVAFYSMATSTHGDAPRGMEFLYSLNRLNVATSRAKCVSILVASPQIFEAECRTPRQIQLANAFCRYLEMAKCIS